MFLCPACGSVFMLPQCSCGYQVPFHGGIYRFCDDPPMKLEGENQYIGYDAIGRDFDPTVHFWDSLHKERYGIYEACADLVAKEFGKNIRVLDLGAGLGAAAIPLAKNSIFTVAADISEVMLSGAAERAEARYPQLILARMNGYRLMLADHTVDIVVENAMLHLVDNPEKIIMEILRVLKPDGHLIRFSSFAQPMSPEERQIDNTCNAILSNICNFYETELARRGYKETYYDNHAQEIILRYFEKDHNAVADISEIFTEKMKFRMHRLKMGAHSGLQHIPKEVLQAVWQITDSYAKMKFGSDYMEIKNFSRYGACLDIYKVKTV